MVFLLFLLDLFEQIELVADKHGEYLEFSSRIIGLTNVIRVSGAPEKYLKGFPGIQGNLHEFKENF
jgi:hypothetical protein